MENVYEELFDKSHFTKQDFYLSWCEVGEIYFKKYLQREITFEQQRINRIQDLYQSIGEYIPDENANQVFEQYLEHFEDNWRAFDDVIPCLNSLSEYRLGIITNGDDDQQKMKLEKMDISEYFEIIVTSGRVGRAKPDSLIFEYACREAGVKPERSAYVGDNLKVDILGCQSYNMNGIWINRDRLDNEGVEVVTITSLEELKQHV